MARHLTQQRPRSVPQRRARRLGLVAAAALLAAGSGLVAPSAWATPSEGPAACEDGLLPLADVTVTVNGVGYEAEALPGSYLAEAAALAPLADVELSYDPDDDLATVDVPAAGCTRGFQLEAFGTQGPDWETSGVQVWEDGAGGTMSAELPTVALSVAVPACYHQTDLSSQGPTFEETDYYDGHDAEHPVPSEPDNIRTPAGLIAAHSGGEGCSEVVPQQPRVRPGCSAEGIAVQVVPDAALAWSYTLDGGEPVAITRQRTVVPVGEDVAYTVVVTAAPVGDATIPEDAQTEWTFEGVRDCVAEPPTEVVPTAPVAEIDCKQGALVVDMTTDENLAWSYAVDGGEPVAVEDASVAVPVQEDAAYTVVVTATPLDGAVLPEGAQSEWTFDGVLDCAEVEDSVTPLPDAGAPVRGGVEQPALAYTGAELGQVVLGSLLLLLGGSGLVLLARRLRSA